AFYEGGATDAVPACSGAFGATPALEGFSNPSSPAATCSTCTCAAPTGATCGDPLLRFSSNATCNAACGTDVTVSGSTCVDLAASLTACGSSEVHVSVVAPTARGGSCVPSTESATVPSWSWGRRTRSCAPAAVPTTLGCSAGQVC